MKKILLLFLAISSWFFASNYDQTNYNQTELCVAECVGWKYAWNYNAAWEFFKYYCTADVSDAAWELVNLGISIMAKDAGVPDIVGTAIQCAIFAKKFIGPDIKSCRETCEIDNTYYAPDLAFGNSYLLDGETHLEIMNIGHSSLPNSTIYVYFYSANSYENLSKAKPELIYTEKLPQIKPLTSYKSFNLEPKWSKTINLKEKMKEKKVYKILAYIVSPYEEVTEGNNIFEETYSKLPSAGNVQFSKKWFKRIKPYTNYFSYGLNFENTGDLESEVNVSFYLDSINGTLLKNESFKLKNLEQKNISLNVNFTRWYQTLFVKIEILEKTNGGSRKREYLMNENSEAVFPNIAFSIYDDYNGYVRNATVKMGPYECTTNSGGSCIITVDKEGNYSIAVSSPYHYSNSTKVEIIYDPFFDTIDVHLVLKTKNTTIKIIPPEKGKILVNYSNHFFFTDKNSITIPYSKGQIIYFSEHCKLYKTNFTEKTKEIKINTTCLYITPNSYSLKQPEDIGFGLWNIKTLKKVIFSKNGEYVYALYDRLHNCYVQGYNIVKKEGLVYGPYKGNCNGYDIQTDYLGDLLIERPNETLLYKPSGGTPILINKTYYGKLNWLGDRLGSFSFKYGKMPLFNASLSSYVLSTPMLCNYEIGTWDHKPAVFVFGYNEPLFFTDFSFYSDDGSYNGIFVFSGSKGTYLYNKKGKVLWKIPNSYEQVEISPDGKWVMFLHTELELYDINKKKYKLPTKIKYNTKYIGATDTGLYAVVREENGYKIYRLSEFKEPKYSYGSSSAEKNNIITQIISEIINFLSNIFHF